MMSKVIDADAAKLAGLQIDLLQKMKQGNVTVEHLGWFLNLNRAQRDELIGKEVEKFFLLADLGTITVPEDYDHEICLARFAKEHRKEFYYFNDATTDENFPNPSRILKAGDVLHVRAFKQIVSGTTTSEERMAFLKGQNTVFVGAQGLSLVFEQKREELPKGKWYGSFDEPDCLWKAPDGRRWVPGMSARSDGGFRWSLGNFEYVWSDDEAFLCFCDSES